MDCLYVATKQRQQIGIDTSHSSDIESGNVGSAAQKLNGTWTSLPGGEETHMTEQEAKTIFKENVSNELKGESSIETPKGQMSLTL